MPRPRRTTLPQHSRATRPPKTIWPLSISMDRVSRRAWTKRSNGISLPPDMGTRSASAIWRRFTTWAPEYPAITRTPQDGFARQPIQDLPRLKTVWGFLTIKVWASSWITGKLRGGCGLPRNYVAAYTWYSRAVVSGDASGVDRRNQISHLMTRKQIDEATSLLTAFSPQGQQPSAGASGFSLVPSH